MEFSRVTLFIAIFVLVILLLYSQNFKSQSKYECEQCNVILISFDALQANHVSSYGYFRNTTPNLDKIAKESIVFKNAISPSSWTVPTYPSWFTSLYPSQHKVVNRFSYYNPPLTVVANLRNLTPDVVTLAEVLKENDYVTAGFTGDAGARAIHGNSIGFDIYIDQPPGFRGFDFSVPLAIQWLKNNTNKKFFMFLHGYDSHGQYDPKEFTKKYVDFNYTGKFNGTIKEQEALREEGLSKGYLNLSEEDVKFWRAWYDEKINAADERFGKFLDEVEKLGLLKNTIIIVSSDHGTEFYEHKRFDHGHTLYDELIKVPFIIKIPNVKNITIEDQVGTISIMPTILDLVKVNITEKVKSQMQGKSLISLMKDEKSNEDVFSETDLRLFTHKRAIRTNDGWKLIYTFAEFPNITNQRELYNLNKDPSEQSNLVEKEPRIAYELEQKLFNHLIDIGVGIRGTWEVGCIPVYNNQCQ